MPRSKVRGGRKQHNKRIQQRKVQSQADIKAIDHLRRQIFEEAVERHKQTSGQTNESKWNIT